MKIFIKLLAGWLNILMPGSGLLFIGHLRTAIIVQTSLLGLLVALCWTRLILLPAGILILIFGSILIYVVSTLLCLTRRIHHPKTRLKWLWQRFGASVLFVIIGIALLVGGFFTKQYWLGIHIYFVPSMSMYPTLKPGQFILLDTWAYWNKEPKVDDVIVFKHDDTDQFLVKRISIWSTGELTEEEKFFVLGDNSQASQDSRHIGGIRKDQMIGKVELVLLGIDPMNKPIKHSFLKLVY